MMRAAFFDFDGTLADTRANIASTVNLMRRELGLEPLDVATVATFVGNGAKRLLERAIPDRNSAELLEVFLRHYEENAAAEVEAYPEVVETLEELQRRGYSLGINTAKPSGALRKTLLHLGLDRFFGKAVIAGGDSPEMKPSARPLLDCAALMNHRVGPDDWMIGDNWTDVGCAAKAGVKSVFCDFGFGTLGSEVPTRRISRFGELLDILR